MHTLHTVLILAGVFALAAIVGMFAQIGWPDSRLARGYRDFVSHPFTFFCYYFGVGTVAIGLALALWPGSRLLGWVFDGEKGQNYEWRAAMHTVSSHLEKFHQAIHLLEAFDPPSAAKANTSVKRVEDLNYSAETTVRSAVMLGSRYLEKPEPPRDETIPVFLKHLRAIAGRAEKIRSGQDPDFHHVFTPAEWAAIRTEKLKSRDEYLDEILSPPDLRIILVLTLLGAFGGCVQGLGATARFVGLRQLRSQWNFFGYSRPLIGAGLAAVFYIFIRGGFLTLQPDSSEAAANVVNLYTFAAVAILVGMSSSQASQKIYGIAESFFTRARFDEDRRATPPSVSADSLSQTITAQQDAGTLVVEGENFSDTLRATLGSKRLSLRVMSPDRLEIELPAGAIAAPGQIEVKLFADTDATKPFETIKLKVTTLV